MVFYTHLGNRLSLSGQVGKIFTVDADTLGILFCIL